MNFHTHPRAIGELFSIRHTGLGWQAAVHPEYYGMMMFAQAAPPGSRLLRISGAAHGPVRAWATSAADRHLRVVLINTGTLERVVLVRASAAVGSGTLGRLHAPSASATGQASLGGQSFGPETGTGLLAGTPQLSFVTPHAGSYAVGLPPASAAMLTLPTH